MYEICIGKPYSICILSEYHPFTILESIFLISETEVKMKMVQNLVIYCIFTLAVRSVYASPITGWIVG